MPQGQTRAEARQVAARNRSRLVGSQPPEHGPWEDYATGNHPADLARYEVVDPQYEIVDPAELRRYEVKATRKPSGTSSDDGPWKDFGKPIPLPSKNRPSSHDEVIYDPNSQFGPARPWDKGDVFDQAAKGDVFDQAADGFQYVKLPDGSYAKFPASMSDADITAALKQSDPLITGRGMEQRAHQQATQAAGEPLRKAIANRAELTAPMPGSFEGHPENIGEYLPATIKPAIAGARDIGRGNFARGAHELIESGANATLPVAALTAGGASLPRLIGTVAGGVAGGKLSRTGARALNLSPDQEDLAGDLGTIAGGYGGSRIPDIDVAPVGNWMASKLRTPYTGQLKPWVPRIPFTKWATEALVPRGEEGSITNPATVMDQDVPVFTSQNPGKYFRTTSVRQSVAPPEIYGPTRINPGDIDPAYLPNYVTPQGPTRVNPSDIDKSNLPDYYEPQGPTRINTGGAPRSIRSSRTSPSDVMVVPEPRPLAPGENPGSMYSVPRAKLRSMAQTGKPGAVDVLRDLGQPSIVLPREGIGYPGPRMSQPLSPEEIDEALRPYRNAAD